MKNAVGYIRVSTEEQAGNDRFGIEAQRTAIEQYAAENNYQIVRWATDTMSGASDERPEWNKILSEDETTNPPIQAVIAFKSDRIARDMKLYFYYLYVLEKRNITMLSTQEDFGEGNPFSNIYRSLMLFVAEQERKNIALRTGTGRKIKAATGGYSGGRSPYGYHGENGRLVIVPAEAEMVRLVFSLRKQGKKLREIVDEINARGYKSRVGTPFNTGTVAGILKNEELYKGKYKYGKDMTERVQGVHEPILTEDSDE